MPARGSGLLGAHEGEHRVVNDVVGRSCPDHGTDRPGQGRLAGRLIKLLVGAGTPAVQDLIIGRGHLDQDPATLGTGLPERLAGSIPGMRAVWHRPNLLCLLQLQQAQGAHIVGEGMSDRRVTVPSCTIPGPGEAARARLRQEPRPFLS